MVDELYLNFKKLKYSIDEITYKFDENQLNLLIEPFDESLAILMKHIGGHLKSRFHLFWEVDGNDNRNKENELSSIVIDLTRFKNDWNDSWNILFHNLSQLSDDDLTKSKILRGGEIKVSAYLLNVYGHTMLHFGQIILLSKVINNLK